MMCPLCNGFKECDYICSTCGHLLKDMGRTTDYLDEYSAYVDFDDTKNVDGKVSHACCHLLYCENCNHEQKVYL
ncbi:hypothetical protein M4D59_00485 [Priestia endophytica]|nr:hypothetical protein [Priestia endophytica]